MKLIVKDINPPCSDKCFQRAALGFRKRSFGEVTHIIVRCLNCSGEVVTPVEAVEYEFEVKS